MGLNSKGSSVVRDMSIAVPTFSSIHILKRSGWQRAHAAITRELSRRQNLEI